MRHDLICSWLDLPAGLWPPDHYTLLGLPPGESDPARIERQVHERLERVRRFQLAHPEQATEAMNRLAQAFICLTEPRTRPADQASLLDQTTPRAVSPPTTVPATAPSEEVPQQLDWRAQPPPQRLATEASPPPAAAATPTLQDTGTAEVIAAVPAPPPAANVEQSWQPLHKGLATRRALLERILLVRQLLHTWRTAGKYLRRSERPLARPAEATELIQSMERARRLLNALPGLLGEAGQPGYLVAALARQPLIVPTVQTLLPSQRAALARDWENGLGLLTAHLGWLRRELHAQRRRSPLGHGLRTVLFTLRERPGLLLFALGLVALNLLPTFRARLVEQLAIVVAYLAFRIFLWWDNRTTVRRVRTAVEPRSSAPRKTRPVSQSRL